MSNQMPDIKVIKGNIVTPTKVLYGGHVVVCNDTIVAVCDSSTLLSTILEPLQAQYSSIAPAVVEAAGFVLPGFVDIHNHGLGGAPDVIGHWSNPRYSLLELARCGTLTTLASIIFSDSQKSLVQRCISVVEESVGHYMENCCILGGIHAEGPVIQDRGGLPECKADLSMTRFMELVESMPSLRIMTISPHVDARSQYEKIKYLLSKRVRVALGHDRVASKKEIMDALRLAPTEEERFHVTHLCNVSTFNHRDSSLVNAALCHQYPHAPLYRGARPPTVEIIADLIHVDSVTVQSVLSCRQPTADVAIITDCISEYRPGKHVRYNGRDSVVRAEGACYLCDARGRPSRTLAGGTSTLADQFYNLITLFHMDVVEACLCTATVPSRIARLRDVGSIEVGKRANILLCNSDLNRIEKRMIHGHWTTHEPYTILRPSTAHM